MANIIVRTLPEQDEVEGMKQAGEVIADLLGAIAVASDQGNPPENSQKRQLAKSFLDDLWGGLNAGEGVPPLGAGYEFRLRVPTGSGPGEEDLHVFRNPQGNGYKYETYRNIGGEWSPEKNLNIKPELDRPVGNQASSNRKMTIAVPEKADDLTADGSYLDRVIGNIVDIATDVSVPSGIRLMNARKYLLAVIFLNRCQ